MLKLVSSVFDISPLLSTTPIPGRRSGRHRDPGRGTAAGRTPDYRGAVLLGCFRRQQPARTASIINRQRTIRIASLFPSTPPPKLVRDPVLLGGRLLRQAIFGWSSILRIIHALSRIDPGLEELPRDSRRSRRPTSSKRRPTKRATTSLVRQTSRASCARSRPGIVVTSSRPTPTSRSSRRPAGLW